MWELTFKLVLLATTQIKDVLCDVLHRLQDGQEESH